MTNNNKQTMQATIRQTLDMYAKYLTDECFTNEDKEFFYNQALACLAKLKAL